jgi:hypothetical protein
MINYYVRGGIKMAPNMSDELEQVFYGDVDLIYKEAKDLIKKACDGLSNIIDVLDQGTDKFMHSVDTVLDNWKKRREQEEKDEKQRDDASKKRDQEAPYRQYGNPTQSNDPQNQSLNDPQQNNIPNQATQSQMPVAWYNDGHNTWPISQEELDKLLGDIRNHEIDTNFAFKNDKTNQIFVLGQDFVLSTDQEWVNGTVEIAKMMEEQRRAVEKNVLQQDHQPIVDISELEFNNFSPVQEMNNEPIDMQTLFEYDGIADIGELFQSDPAPVLDGQDIDLDLDGIDLGDAGEELDVGAILDH